MFNLPLLDKFFNFILNEKKKLLFNDRLNCIITPTILLIFAIILTTKQHIGKPINCITPSEFGREWAAYAENYCFLNPLYPSLKNKNKPLINIKNFSYYSWVPFILSLQSLMFHAPSIIWHYIIKTSIFNYKNLFIDQNQDSIRFAILSLNGNKFINKNFYTSIYLLLKIFYVANIILQYYIVTKFLGFNYLLWGIEFILTKNLENFTYINYCELSIMTLGNLQTYSIQCFLSINILNKLVFLSLWFWFAFLLACNIFTIMNFLITFIYSYRLNHFKRYLKNCYMSKFISHFVSSDIYLLFLFIESQSNIVNTMQFCSLLYKIYRDTEFNKDIIT